MISPQPTTRVTAAWCLVAVTTACLTGSGVAEEPVADDAAAGGIVARVGTMPIPREVFEAVLSRVGLDQSATPDRRRQLEATVLAQLVDEQLLHLPGAAA